jgi:hypothetical protein
VSLTFEDTDQTPDDERLNIDPGLAQAVHDSLKLLQEGQPNNKRSPVLSRTERDSVLRQIKALNERKPPRGVGPEHFIDRTPKKVSGKNEDEKYVIVLCVRRTEQEKPATGDESPETRAQRTSRRPRGADA